MQNTKAFGGATFLWIEGYLLYCREVLHIFSAVRTVGGCETWSCTLKVKGIREHDYEENIWAPKGMIMEYREGFTIKNFIVCILHII